MDRETATRQSTESPTFPAPEDSEYPGRRRRDKVELAGGNCKIHVGRPTKFEQGADIFKLPWIPIIRPKLGVNHATQIYFQDIETPMKPQI